MEDKSHEISARENALCDKENAVSEMFKACEAIQNGFESLKTEVLKLFLGRHSRKVLQYFSITVRTVY